MGLLYHYAFDAAKLLIVSLAHIQEVIETDEQSSRGFYTSSSSLYDMKEALVQAENQLFCYFQYIIQNEVEKSPDLQVHKAYQERRVVDLASAADFLKFVLLSESSTCCNQENDVNGKSSYYPRRNVTDSLLFRLNVALQLCMVRIDDSRSMITGRRHRDAKLQSALVVPSFTSTMADTLLPIATALLGISTISLSYARQKMVPIRALVAYQPMLMKAAQSGAAILALRWCHTKWSHLWMAMKLNRSTHDIEEWNTQWSLVLSTPWNRMKTIQAHRPSSPSLPTDDDSNIESDNREVALDAARSQRLIEYALHETPKTSFWHSQGELRFLMLKRAMDVFYASVGTAMDLTEPGDSHDAKKKAVNNWQLNVATAAAASFYSLTGARERAAAVTSSSESASKLIQNAWGMVSLPSVKTLSLQASKLLKGAAVADRIEICGVHCFVLSSEPAPEVAAAIKRNHRLHQRRKPITRLSTIDETEEHVPSRPSNSIPFARSSTTRYRQRNVIFHLTGGGFFAHIIATDLPHLLDWSAATQSVVICPEYALLPEHTFPVALDQVEQVYRALVSNEAVSVLGFETNRIIVTGESAGGNLAASLCVSLCSGGSSTSNPNSPRTPPQPSSTVIVENDWHALRNSESSSPGDSEITAAPVRMPTALMLSCPVLNLSLELCYSGVVGAEDPVLPSGLISAISDAYLPARLGISKRNPLASPFYAPDAILRQFPPTLLFASSTDPLLDDSVSFNQRLKQVGVPSDLVAAHNLPHAYLGLGTAGFPEARQVQERCISWLKYQFTRRSVKDL